MLIARHAAAIVRAAMGDTPVVVVNGPRQAGKSTLVRELKLTGRVEMVSLDDESVREFARLDPRGFVDRPVDTLIIDEVQLEPRLFRAIKAAVDRDRRPGRFLLTGSARLLSAPDMADALVGRVETIDLWPFTQGELDGATDRFADQVFTAPVELMRTGAPARGDYIDLAIRGGFPDAVARTPKRRRDWFESYATTIVQRAVLALSDIDRLAEIPRLVRLCAARSAQELNVTAIAHDMGIPAKTIDSYLALLTHAFILTPIPAWSTNLSAKVVRRPKLHLVDSGLAAHLLGITAASAHVPSAPLGPLIETFAAMQLARQLPWSVERPTLWHFRDRNGQEVDLILEHPDGRIVGIEVKASSTVGARDFRGLRYLQDRLGDRFAYGVVLHTANEALPFGERLAALPLSALWWGSSGPTP
jgi:uncharacterized protein